LLSDPDTCGLPCHAESQFEAISAAPQWSHPDYYERS
jgi:hypothetical protein